MPEGGEFADIGKIAAETRKQLSKNMWMVPRLFLEASDEPRTEQEVYEAMRSVGVKGPLKISLLLTINSGIIKRLPDGRLTVGDPMDKRWQLPPNPFRKKGAA